MQRKPSSFVYRKTFAFPEKGGRTWRLVDQLVKDNRNGAVTMHQIEGGLCRTVAVLKSRKKNQQEASPT